MKTYRSQPWGLALLGLLLASACGEDFDPYGRITEFRVLALRADPPDVRSGERTRIEALVVGTATTALVQYRWRWCPLIGSPNQGFECLLDEATLGAFLPPGVELPSFELGQAASAELAYPSSPEALSALCDALSRTDIPNFQSQVSCDDGFEVYVRLDAEFEGRTQSVLKTVRFLIDPDATPNANPTQLSLDLPARVERDEDIDLRVNLDSADAETYEGVPRDDPGGEARELRERLIVSWFATAGTFDPERDSFIDGERDLGEAEETTWTSPLPADFDRDEVDFFVVLRDDRGGTTWTDGALQLAEGGSSP